jgi:undecaprenyl-diphosphatase
MQFLTEVVSSIDRHVVSGVMTLIEKWPALYSFSFMLNNHLMRTVPFIAAVILVLAQNGRYKRLRIVLAIIAGYFATIVVSQLLQNHMPYHPRPLFDPTSGYQLQPGGDASRILADWSSFPSDTAAISMAFTVALFKLNRKVGVLGLLWTIAVTSQVKLIMGHHYLSDILAGMVVGAACMMLAFAAVELIPERTADSLFELTTRFDLFWPLLYVALFLVSTNFDDARSIARRVLSGVAESKAQAREATTLAPLDLSNPLRQSRFR